MKITQIYAALNFHHKKNTISCLKAVSFLCYSSMLDVRMYRKVYMYVYCS